MTAPERTLLSVIFVPVLLIIPVFLTAGEPVSEAPRCAVEMKADSILNLLTLEEKVALLHANSKFTSTGVPRLGIPELASADGPTGVREELERDSWEPLNLPTDSATFFPAGPSLAATWNVGLARRYGEALGEETRARGKDILLAPSVNIIRTPLSGRNFEFFTEDPVLNAEIAVAYIQGLQSRDVAACIKHYAVNNQEFNRWRVDVLMNERTLREIYLPVYRAAVERAHVLSFMGAYNKFRGWYLCENDYLLNDVLKKEWGFKGIVISDWGATHSTIDAAMHGLDIEMGSRGDYSSYHFADPLLKAVREGDVPVSVIDDKAKRVLYVMLRCRTMSEDRQQGSICTPEHFKTAYDVAAESIVLLKNTDSVLPVQVQKIRKLAVLGENAVHRHAIEGFGAGVKTKYEMTPLEGLKKKLGDRVEILFAQGYREKYNFLETGMRWRIRVPDNDPDSVLIREAVEVARGSDAVIIFGGSNRTIESEASDRRDMALPFGQAELIRAVTAVNPNTVLVLIASAPYDLTAVEPVTSAILWGWFNGSEAGSAMADVLTGDVNPSGKLPFTMPVRLEDSPAHALDAYPGEDNAVYYKEGVLVGYRWFDTRNIDPLYCFGHGLSYTDFTLSSFKTDKTVYGQDESIQLECRVKNTGHREGAETVQIYVHDTKASVLRPSKELKAFQKVVLKPGRQQTVRFSLNIRDLAFYDDMRREWKVEPGQFELLFGTSSRDIHGSMMIDVE
ncbi:glycoside hydrolase family 3 C-terminal domain-containing protein [bacterium]|nr:glycoside hydrolase family 3 C-terminal domain-containing protein [bacterium]